MTGKGSCEGPEQLQADTGKDWKMSYYRKTIVPNIEAHYENLSAVEKNIADFFISNEEDMDFSSRHISSMLYVSEASLSRFAKKCGYKGYREFVFKYKESFGEKGHQITGQMREVFDSYQELLNKSYNLADEAPGCREDVRVPAGFCLRERKFQPGSQRDAVSVHASGTGYGCGG